MKVILVIAEDEGLRAAIRAGLPESDLVIFSQNAEEGLRRLVSIEADAILVDESAQQGARSVSAVRRAAPDTPIVALSAHKDVLTHAGLLKAGADDVLVKPFSCEDLLAAVGRKALNGRDKTPSGNGQGAIAATASMAALPQYQAALRWISRSAMYSGDTARLSESLVEVAADIFDAVRCAVLLEHNGGVGIAAAQGLPAELRQSIRLSFAHGLMRSFDERASLMDRDRAMAAGALREMQLLSAELAVPLLRNGRVIGAIILGEKASGAIYTQEERELLSLLARSASIAFEQADTRAEVTKEFQNLEESAAHLPFGLVYVDAGRLVRILNPQAEMLLGLRAAETIGRSVQQLGSAFADAVLRTLRDGRTRTNVEVTDALSRKRLTLTVTPTAQGAAVATFARLDETRVKSEDIAYSPFWEYLSARVAQEVKNPMVAINTFAQLLPRKHESEEFREAFSRVVQKEVERINSVVDTLFDFSRHPSLTIRGADLNATVQEVLKRFEDELNARGIKLEERWAENLDPAQVDTAYFAQAISHLVRNAVDAMPEGGTLRVATRKDGDRAEVLISDTGTGVRAEDEPLIFLPFYSTREKGMGLGLTLADRILRQHHGDVKLVERGPQGSSFAVHVPMKGTSDADDSGD